MSNLHKKDDLNALKDAVDISYLLDSLGIRGSRESSKEIRASCSIHGGDNKSAFRFNKEKRTWVCFTHKCHDIHGNDIIGLIKAVLGVDFIGALNYLKGLTGDVSLYRKSYNEKKFENERNSFINSYSKPKLPNYVSEDSLNMFKHLRSNYFIDQKYKKSTLDSFEIAGGFTDAFGIVRDIIPIRNVKNDLVAYSLRDIRENPPDTDFKYILTEGFVKDNVIYNLNYARVFSTSVPLIIVEGFKSVWRFHEYGLYNTVAVMGSCITLGQIKLLKAYALNGVVVMFDPDKAGKEGTVKAIEDLSEHMPVHSVYMDICDGEDPAELNLSKAYGYLNEFIR
jgi:DNA primase